MKTKNVNVSHQNATLFFHNVATTHFQSAHLEGLTFPLVRLVRISALCDKALLEEDLQIQDSNPKITTAMLLLQPHHVCPIYVFGEKCDRYHK